MALISCPDCQKQVSSNAAACLHCGAPIQGANPNNSYQSNVSSITLKRHLNPARISDQSWMAVYVDNVNQGSLGNGRSMTITRSGGFAVHIEVGDSGFTPTIFDRKGRGVILQVAPGERSKVILSFVPVTGSIRARYVKVR